MNLALSAAMVIWTGRIFSMFLGGFFVLFKPSVWEVFRRSNEEDRLEKAGFFKFERIARNPQSKYFCLIWSVT
jgi:hypothetical protein